MAMTALFAGALVLAGPAVKLQLTGPADGFIAGREDAIVIAAVDTAGTLTAATGTPAVNGPVTGVERIVDGLWQVKALPGAAGGTVTAALDGVTGRLDLKPAPATVLAMSLNDAELSPLERGTIIAIVDVKSSTGAPVEDMTPVVTASMGSVGAAKRLSPGRWSFGVKMSDKKYPHAALVTASLPRRDVKPVAASVVLHGKAAFPIVSEPKARITVRVGKKSVGPLLVGSTGQVDAVIEAGPADNTMEVESVDPAGNRKTDTVPLDLPPYPRLWAQAQAMPNALDSRTRVTVQAASLDRRGALGSEPKASVAGSAIPLEGGNGVFTGSAILALAPGTHTVTVSLGDEKLTFPITAAPPPPVGIAMDVSPTTVSMGGAPAMVAAYRVDAQGKRVIGGEAPKLAPEGLKIIGTTTSAETSSAKIEPIEGKIPAATWIAARASGPGFALSAKRTLTVMPGEPFLVEILQVEPPRLPADGKSTSLLQARVTDKWGNPVGGAKIDTKASAGKVVSTKEPELGMYHVVIRAPDKPSAGSMSVTAGAATRDALITFVRPPPKWSIAGGAGGGHNLGAMPSFQAWGEMRRALGGIDESPWAATIRVTTAQGAFAVDTPATGKWDITVRQALAMAGVRRRFSAPFSGWTVAAILSAGGGTVQVAETNGMGTFVENGSTFGGRGAAMFERNVGRSGWIVELGYSHVIADETVIEGNLGGMDLTVGYRHGF